MLFLASSPADREAYRKAWDVPEDISDSELMTALSQISSEKYSKDKETGIFIANAILTEGNIPVNPDFLHIYSETFSEKDGVFCLKDGPAVVAHINKWIEFKTRGNLKNFWPADFKPCVAFINAFYARLDWPRPFPQASNANFTCANGATVSAKFMNLNAVSAFYCQSQGYDFIKIPFEDSEASFVALMPSSEEDMRDLKNEISVELIASLIKEAKWESSVDVTLPKLHIESSISKFEDLLKQTGIPPKHTFEYMLNEQEPDYVNVITKVVLDINEQGAIGAAATVGGSFRCSPDKRFKATRPFIFALIPKDAISSSIFRVCDRCKISCECQAGSACSSKGPYQLTGCLSKTNN